MAFVAFDLEMDGPQVLCAATWTRLASHAAGQVDGQPRLWTRTDSDGKYAELCEADLLCFLEYLEDAAQQGATLVSWGGTCSDWKVLHDSFTSEDHKRRVQALARAHVDIPLIACASSGMMMGLEAARHGMQIGSFFRTLESAAVPGFWRSRELPLQNLVLQHVAEDAFHTAAIYTALMARPTPTLSWITLRRKLRSLTLTLSRASATPALPSVAECMTWSAPLADFPIPPQFRVATQTAWL